MHKYLFAPLLFLGLITGAQAQDVIIDQIKLNGSDSTGPGYQFTTLHDAEATSIKNQGRSGTCWSYATSSFLESELLRQDDNAVNLSEMYTVRQVYLDKARKYVRLHGNLKFGQGGALPDMLHVIEHYGAVPEEVYQGLNYGTSINNHGELEAILKAQLDQVIKNHNEKLTPRWLDALESTLDAYLGEVPETFEYEGTTYTPRSFADDYLQIDPADYVQLTSFTHHPLHEEVVIQVPDNWTWGPSFNVSLDEFVAAVDHSLEQGYTVDWAADVSEKGFSLQNGLAIVPETPLKEMSADQRKAAFQEPQPQREITPEMRQKEYDNYQTTDDHAMHITALVEDQNGQHYYSVKNSWGERENEYKDGYLQVSQAYLRYKSISAVFHRDALPPSLRKMLPE